MSWLSSFLHPQKGYHAGQQQLDKYFDQAQGNLQPYNQNGQDQYANLNEIIKNLTDPTELNKKWIESYTESPQAIQAETMAQEHGMNAANSMGLMGSNTALNATQAGTTQIGLNDRQNYLDDLMKKYMAGAGLSQGIYGTGAGAAGQQSTNAMNQGQNSAQLAFGEKNAPGSMFGNLLGAGAGLLGSYLGGNNNTNKWNLSGGA